MKARWCRPPSLPERKVRDRPPLNTSSPPALCQNFFLLQLPTPQPPSLIPKLSFDPPGPWSLVPGHLSLSTSWPLPTWTSTFFRHHVFLRAIPLGLLAFEMSSSSFIPSTGSPKYFSWPFFSLQDIFSSSQDSLNSLFSQHRVDSFSSTE